MRYAVKVAYDGRKFHGSQRQPGLRTVEGDFLKAAVASGVIGDLSSFSAASRTDAGVSALSNVFSFESDLPEEAIIPCLNRELDDIWVRATAIVPDDFNPRWARVRTYRYYLPYRPEMDISALKDAALLFRGEHDFSAYGRDRESNPIIEIEDIKISRMNLLIDRLHEERNARDVIANFIEIEIKAGHFLWNMVRRMVGVLEAVSMHNLSRDELLATLSGARIPSRVAVAMPDFLVLHDVEYDGISFKNTLPSRASASFSQMKASNLLFSIFLAELYGIER